MKQFIITCLFSLLLVGCVTESVRIIPIKVSVKAGVDFNPCGSDVEGYKFEPNGIISINCTNGNIYSVRNRQQLEKMKKNVIECQQKGFHDYSECLSDKNTQKKKQTTPPSNLITKQP
ncbi:hypothetical protein CTM97_17695 [Photobacterium phosphoreum]|uniref:Lipoprotein n=1 Tax=Photobacterium phosphoreum TaxID=659 RepID=A0A2T3JCW1_PHOPO|nr:hypothetical protein [Photobacterium phosphoreum]PSU20495.1 hypothetical protein CTM96_19450 [Photobacterium phosphoreum]PSU39336.1 hypothetical protein CTM97_17695 [Photobacterium phosphoreum]PSU46699.1 hypothetical protein C9J18_20285 [Photobacterium phosphoreum]